MNSDGANRDMCHGVKTCDAEAIAVQVSAALSKAKEAQFAWSEEADHEKLEIIHRLWKTTGSDHYRFCSDAFIDLKIPQMKIYASILGDNVEYVRDYCERELEKPAILLDLGESPPYILHSVVAPALIFWYPIVVSTKRQDVLEEVKKLQAAGVPENMVTVFTNPRIHDYLLTLSEFDKIILARDYDYTLAAIKKSPVVYCSFVLPNKTFAVLLESCDLAAAVEKLVFETWDKRSDGMWGVSKFLVQESIFKKFLKHLAFYLMNIERGDLRTPTESKKLTEVRERARRTGSEILEVNGATVLLYDHTSRDEELSLPFTKVLVFRTPKEAVEEINNSHYCLGTSIWSEVHSQVLEVSGMLDAGNIWINCHGIMSSCEPFVPFGLGNVHFAGGKEGLLQYADLHEIKECSAQIKDNTFSWEEVVDWEKENGLDSNFELAVELADKAFKLWMLEKDKKFFFIKPFEACKEEFKIPFSLENTTSFNSTYTSTSNDRESGFVTIPYRAPLGVIVLFTDRNVMSFPDFIALTALITRPLVAGNAVVVVLERRNRAISRIVEILNESLPKDLLKVVVQEKFEVPLATCNSLIQNVWIHTFSPSLLKLCKEHWPLTLRRYWFIPSYFPLFHIEIYSYQFLKTKTVCMAKVDQM